MKNWHTKLKVLVDANRATRFIASGSAAAALNRASNESGAGRFTDFLLPPLNFKEYLDLLGLGNPTIVNSSTDMVRLNKHFENYLNFGGYPEAVFNTEIQKNISLVFLPSAITSYLVGEFALNDRMTLVQEALKIAEINDNQGSE